MTTLVPGPVHVTDALKPVRAAIRAMYREAAGLAPHLLVTDDRGWTPATGLVSGAGIDDLLDAARDRWQASPHAAAALAWKHYSYWLALPAVLGWAAARRVPLLRPADVLIRLPDAGPLLRVGLRPSVTVAVLPTDPVARADTGSPLVVVDNEAVLLAALRTSLLDAHLTPLADVIQARAKVGLRTLRGSISSGVAHGILRAAHALPGPAPADVATLLTALDLDDLVELVPGRDGAVSVLRKTCCLAFTLPQPKVCTGCCISV